MKNHQWLCRFFVLLTITFTLLTACSKPTVERTALALQQEAQLTPVDGTCVDKSVRLFDPVEKACVVKTYGVCNGQSLYPDEIEPLLKSGWRDIDAEGLVGDAYLALCDHELCVDAVVTLYNPTTKSCQQKVYGGCDYSTLKKDYYAEQIQPLLVNGVRDITAEKLTAEQMSALCNPPVAEADQCEDDVFLALLPPGLRKALCPDAD